MSRELDQMVDGLKQSPLFWFSLASKELFHSSFLAWLSGNPLPNHGSGRGGG
jgi:hypothetical protein